MISVYCDKNFAKNATGFDYFCVLECGKIFLDCDMRIRIYYLNCDGKGRGAIRDKGGVVIFLKRWLSSDVAM
jgi:hypothetical protein